MNHSGKKLGEILIDKGILSPLTVDRMLVISWKHNKRFGVTLEDSGLVTGEELAEALAEQYCLTMISDFSTMYYPPALLALITPEVATQNLIFPLNIEGDFLELALADPTDMKIAKNVAANNNLKLVPLVATRKEIHKAICLHYLGREDEEATDRTVLVVDDDFLICTMVSDILTGHGYRVLTSKDGMEGFKEVIARKPHIIITDKVMPKIDGIAFFNSLKAIPETRGVPVILISSWMSAEEEAAAFEIGFFDFIPKPLNALTLLTRVKRAFWFHDHKYRLF